MLIGLSMKWLVSSLFQPLLCRHVAPNHKTSRSVTIWNGLKLSIIPSDVTCAGRSGSRLSRRSQLKGKRFLFLVNNREIQQEQSKHLLPGFFDWKSCAQSCSQAAPVWFIETHHKGPFCVLSLLVKTLESVSFYGNLQKVRMIPV